MPGDFEITFPYGRSLNVTGGIQIESDWTLIGGVSPTAPIPMNSTNAIHFIQGKLSSLESDFELEYAQKELEHLISTNY